MATSMISVGRRRTDQACTDSPSMIHIRPSLSRRRGKPTPVCVASASSGQNARRKMRDFDLLRKPRRWSEVDEQARVSTIYGGTEAGDLTRGGSAGRDGERGVSASRAVPLGAIPMSGGGPGRIGGGTET